jgi:hypothetical protein
VISSINFFLYNVILSICFTPYDAFIMVFTVFRLMTDFFCLYSNELWLSLCKIARQFCYYPYSNCYIACDIFKLLYIMWYLETVYAILYIQTVLYHAIPWNCLIPCDTFKLFYAMWYSLFGDSENRGKNS